MKGWITLTHYMSGEKIHLKVDKVIGVRERPTANLLLIQGSPATYIKESIEELDALIKIGEEER